MPLSWWNIHQSSADASMAWLLHGQVSADELLASILNFVPDDYADTLRHVLAHPEQLSDRTLLNKCLRITTGLGGRKMPDQNVRSLLESLARFCLIRQVMCPLLGFKRGLQCYTLLWTGCGVDVSNTLHTDGSPDWDKVLSVLHYGHSVDPDLRTLEEEFLSAQSCIFGVSWQNVHLS